MNFIIFFIKMNLIETPDQFEIISTALIELFPNMKLPVSDWVLTTHEVGHMMYS